MSKGIGYLMPPGDAFISDLACVLVFYPDKAEYRRALRGSLDYLGTWLAWEKDTEKRALDAARAWKEANEATWECMEMEFCNELLTSLQNIEALLEDGQGCCGSTTVGDVNNVTTIIVPGVGGDPTEWGETAVADCDEWGEYVCYYANKFVDNLVSSAETLDTVAEIGHWTVEFFSNILRLLRFFSLVYPVSYAAALEIYESFKAAGDSSDTFDGVAVKFEAGRDDIVCAFMLGNSVSDAVETVLDDVTLWGLLYQFNDYDTTQALVYEGTVDGSVYLPSIKRDDCSCEEYDCVQYANWAFDTGTEGHTLVSWSWLATELGEPGVVKSPSTSEMPATSWQTPDFTTGEGSTGIRSDVRLWKASGQGMHIRIYVYRKSDDQLLGNFEHPISAGGGGAWVDHSDSLVCVAGEEYYARVRATVSGGPAPVRISEVKITDYPCEDA